MKPARIVLAAAVLALALKLAWAATSTGTNDTMVFFMFGMGVHQEGLLELYKYPLFNHTPFIGTLVGAFFSIADSFASQTQRGPLFALLLRTPGILADFGSVLAMLWIRRRTGQPPWWALVLFALSPVSLMVSGYHGNVDSLMVFALTLAACACVARQPALCGLALAGALQVKVVAMLVAPALLAWWWQQGRAREFFLTTAVVTLTGWIVPLVAMPQEFIGHVLTYPSYWGSWGTTLLLRLSGLPAFQNVGFTDSTQAQSAVVTALKLIIIGSASFLAWRRRTCDATGVFHTIALTWLVFFTFAPGFGGQYLVWLMPFAVMLSPRWFAVLTAASTVFLYRFYDVISKVLRDQWFWHHGVSTSELEPKWVFWTFLPWLVFAAWMFHAMREELSGTSASREPQTAA